MPNYEDFKKYGEMEKQKKADQAARLQHRTPRSRKVVESRSCLAS